MLQSLCGLIVIPLIAWLLCERRAEIPVFQAGKIAAGGIALQFIIAGLFILIPQLGFVFDLLASAVIALQTATGTGMKFLFGYLAGGPTPFTVTKPLPGSV
ncbi:MAG: Na+ dependent nucleoside transporter N-terminal domain-containing protein, partial [Pseudomonadota bacterium]